MSAGPVIEVESVAKKFCRGLKRSLWYGVQDMVSEASGRRRNGSLRRDEFWAVRDVSFQLRRGECFGVIGRNGAGKTTLLRLVTGLCKPDTGTIQVRGRLGAMIALGAGFSSVLTGRENIYVNAAVIGLSRREVDRRIDGIIDFAELGEFIDAPVQTYSSGMYVRLGFAIATTLEPDVLVLDEVLAVGDAAFRNKCYARIAALMENACCIVVAHDLNVIGRMTQRCLLLNQGKVVASGPTAEVVERYRELLDGCADSGSGLLLFDDPLSDANVSVECRPDSEHAGYVHLVVTVNAVATADLGDVSCRILILTNSEAVVEWSSFGSGVSLHLGSGTNRFAIAFDPICLARGRYTVNCVVNDSKGVRELIRSNDMMTFDVMGADAEVVRVRLKARSCSQLDG